MCITVNKSPRHPYCPAATLLWFNIRCLSHKIRLIQSKRWLCCLGFHWLIINLSLMYKRNFSQQQFLIGPELLRDINKRKNKGFIWAEEGEKYRSFRHHIDDAVEPYVQNQYQISALWGSHCPRHPST